MRFLLKPVRQFLVASHTAKPFFSLTKNTRYFTMSVRNSSDHLNVKFLFQKPQKNWKELTTGSHLYAF
jgi:hypothetical protein